MCVCADFLLHNAVFVCATVYCLLCWCSAVHAVFYPEKIIERGMMLLLLLLLVLLCVLDGAS